MTQHGSRATARRGGSASSRGGSLGCAVGLSGIVQAGDRHDEAREYPRRTRFQPPSLNISVIFIYWGCLGEPRDLGCSRNVVCSLEWVPRV